MAVALFERIPAKWLKVGNKKNNDGFDGGIEVDVGLGLDNPKLYVVTGDVSLRSSAPMLLEDDLDVIGATNLDSLVVATTSDLGAASADSLAVSGAASAASLAVSGAASAASLTVTGTVIFQGTLEVQGTLTYLNTTNMRVEDKNIEINYGSTTANAEGAGFDVLGTSNASLGKLIYAAAVPSRFKMGPSGSEKTVLVTGEVRNADIPSDAAIADTKLATISTAGKVANSATTGTSSNGANTLVQRGAGGEFTAGIITAGRFDGTLLTAPTHSVFNHYEHNSYNPSITALNNASAITSVSNTVFTRVGNCIMGCFSFSFTSGGSSTEAAMFEFTIPVATVSLDVPIGGTAVARAGTSYQVSGPVYSRTYHAGSGSLTRAIFQLNSRGLTITTSHVCQVSFFYLVT